MAEIKTDSLSDYYEVKEELGRGRFAVVKRCIKISTGEVFAAKCIRKARAGRRGREQLLLEIDILYQSDHPKLVKLYDVFETNREMILILEYAAGGDLHKHCLEQIDSVRTEKEICSLSYQIVEAAMYLHENNVVHLDLKPENILLKNDERFPEIRLIDFGLSRRVDLPYSQYDIVGTPEYVAPEVLAYEAIELSADLWSIGVVTYVLLSGISPFAGDDVMETYGNISNVDFDFDAEEFDDISDEAKDFVECLLIKDPKERLTIKECLEHPWLKQMEHGVMEQDIAAAIKAETVFNTLTQQESSSEAQDSEEEDVFSEDDAEEEQEADSKPCQDVKDEKKASVEIEAVPEAVVEREDSQNDVADPEVTKQITDGLLEKKNRENAVNHNEVKGEESYEKSEDEENYEAMSEVKGHEMNEAMSEVKAQEDSEVQPELDAGIEKCNDVTVRNHNVNIEETEIKDRKENKMVEGGEVKKPSMGLFDIDSLLCNDEEEEDAKTVCKNDMTISDDTVEQNHEGVDVGPDSWSNNQDFENENMKETNKIINNNVDVNVKSSDFLAIDGTLPKVPTVGNEIPNNSKIPLNHSKSVPAKVSKIDSNDLSRSNVSSEKNSDDLERSNVSSKKDSDDLKRSNVSSKKDSDDLERSNVSIKSPNDLDRSDVSSEQNGAVNSRYGKQKSAEAAPSLPKSAEEFYSSNNSKIEHPPTNDQKLLVKMKSVDENMLIGRKKSSEIGKNKLGAHLEKLTKAGLNFSSENDLRRPGPMIVKQGSTKRQNSADKIVIDTSPYSSMKDINEEPRRKNSSQSSKSSGSSGRGTPDSGLGTPTGGMPLVFPPAADAKDVKITPHPSLCKQTAPVEEKAAFPKRSAIANLGVRQGIAAQMASKFASSEKKEAQITAPAKVNKAVPQCRISNKKVFEPQSPVTKNLETTSSRSPQRSPLIERAQKFLNATIVADNESKSPKNSPKFDRSTKFANVQKKAKDVEEKQKELETSEVSRNEKVKRDRQARRQSKSPAIKKQDELVDGVMKKASSKEDIIQKFERHAKTDSDQDNTHQVIVQPKGLQINFSLQAGNKFKAKEMNVPIQVDHVKERQPSANKWEAKLSKESKPVKFRVGEVKNQGNVNVPAQCTAILDHDHDFNHVEHTAIGAIATMPRTPLRELRGKSRTSRDRGDSSPSSPRKSYRRLYVTHVKGSKSEQEADIPEDIAEFKTKVEKDELKVELLVKFPDIKFGTL